MVLIEENWVWEGMERERGHTLRAGQRAHDFGWNGHYEGEAVRIDTLANTIALGETARKSQVTDYGEDSYQLKDVKTRGQQRRKS